VIRRGVERIEIKERILVNSKKILAAAVSVAAIASLAACGGVKDDANAGSSDAVTIGTTDKITSLDPAASYDNGSYAVQIQVFPFLYAQDYNTADLSADIAADDGTWSDDGTEFTVKLKSGLKFANGNDLTASDVKFSYDRIKTINDENGPSSLLANVESVEAKDDTTVVFKETVPFDVTLKQVMSSPAGPIVDEDVFAADKVTDADTIVKGDAFAGPYKLTSFKLNEALAYAKNDSYKGLTPAKNNAVQVKYFADASNLKMAVQQAQIDVAYRSLTPTDIEDLSKDSKVKVVKGPGGEERLLVFNFKLMPYGEKSSEPNADKAKAVRQAVANLIDRSELSEKVYKSTYTPMYSFIPDGLSGHEDTLKSAYGDGSGKPDADKAKKVLEAAGVTTPVDLKLQYNGDHYGSSSADEYAAIKAQLEEGGLFKVDLQQTEWTQYNKDRVVTEDSDGAYPVYQLGWFPDYSDPDNYLSPFFRDGNFVNNGYANSEVNDLIVKQAGEKDATAREDILKQIQQLETEDLSTIPLLQGAQVAVTGTSVKGVVLDASFRFRYASVTK
jgi:peptide/nickel transport system substrate-binding protein